MITFVGFRSPVRLMHLLILGGTVFLGRHVVEAALARDHRVTLFNRGSRPVRWPGVAQLTGDRDGGLDALAGHRFDAVVDTSGYVPRLVGASARLLADAVEHYTFVSSASAYRDFSRPGIDESAPVRTIDDPGSEDVAAHYGALKALSERAVDVEMPGRALHVRAGLIVGPFDPTGRFGYWVRRVGDGGDILAPGDPSRPVQFIDARDLAEWIVTMAERRQAGIYNAAGPHRRCTMGELLDACRGAQAGTFTWADDAFLVEHDIAPFTGLPLWLPPGSAGLLALDIAKAVAAGLRSRPIAETVRDTAAWLATSDATPPTAPVSGVPARPNAGLADARERALLTDWRSRARTTA